MQRKGRRANSLSHCAIIPGVKAPQDALEIAEQCVNEMSENSLEKLKNKLEASKEFMESSDALMQQFQETPRRHRRKKSGGVGSPSPPIVPPTSQDPSSPSLSKEEAEELLKQMKETQRLLQATQKEREKDKEDFNKMKEELAQLQQQQNQEENDSSQSDESSSTTSSEETPKTKRGRKRNSKEQEENESSKSEEEADSKHRHQQNRHVSEPRAKRRKKEEEDKTSESSSPSEKQRDSRRREVHKEASSPSYRERERTDQEFKKDRFPVPEADWSPRFDVDEDSQGLTDEEAKQRVRMICEFYQGEGYKKVQDHQLFQFLAVDRLERTVFKAMNRNEKGVITRAKLDGDTKGWIDYVQDHIIKYDREIHHPLTENVLFDVFGLKAGVESLSLWEKINLIARLAQKVGLGSHAIADMIKKKSKIVKAITGPVQTFKGVDVNHVSAPDLQSLSLNDIVKAPARWQDFIDSSKEQGANRRELFSALYRRYHAPLKAHRSDKIVMQHLYEAEEHLFDIRALLSMPKTVETPREIKEQIELILLRKTERLETLRIWSTNPALGAKFFSLVREEQPSRTKDLEKIEKKAQKELKKEGPAPLGRRDFLVLAQGTSNQKARPEVTFSVGAPPLASSSSSPSVRSERTTPSSSFVSKLQAAGGGRGEGKSRGMFFRRSPRGRGTPGGRS